MCWSKQSPLYRPQEHSFMQPAISNWATSTNFQLLNGSAHSRQMSRRDGPCHASPHHSWRTAAYCSLDQTQARTHARALQPTQSRSRPPKRCAVHYKPNGLTETSLSPDSNQGSLIQIWCVAFFQNPSKNSPPEPHIRHTWIADKFRRLKSPQLLRHGYSWT